MNRVFNRIISFVLCIAVVVVIIPAASLSASAASEPTCQVQWQEKWKSYYYGKSSTYYDNLYNSGCGMFSFCNAVHYLTGNNPSVTAIAQWASDNNYLNGTYGGGTARSYYSVIDSKYGSTYGFNVETILWSGWSNATLKSHVANGGTAIGHVPGHFIAIVGYDYSTDKFHIYDSAPSNGRGTKSGNGNAWITSSTLIANSQMKLDWFCNLSRTGAAPAWYGGASNPQGVVDGIGTGAQKVSFNGWAFDADNSSQSLEIRAYIGGDIGVGEAHSFMANLSRPDVNSAYGITGNHGFATEVSTNLVGEQQVYIYAVNIGGGDNTLLGKYTVTIASYYGLSAGEPSNLGDSFYARIYNPEYDKYVALRSDGALFAESKQLKQSQVWKFERNADDASYKITSTESGKNIDLVDSNSTPGTDIIVWEETGTDAQRWYLVSKNGGYVLQCKAAKSNALDIDNGGQTEIACWEEYGGVNQVFQIQTVSDPYELWAGAPANLGDSFYARIYNTEYNKYIGLEGDRPTALEKTSDSSQVWKFERQANDASYKIINTKNGKNLDLNGGNDTAGTDVVTYHDNGADNQRWYLVAKDGGYMLQSKCAKNNALDIDTGGQKWIANWAAHGGVNQLFNIQTVTGAYELSAGDSADLGNAFYARIYNSEFNKYIGLLEERPTALDATTDSSQIWKFERHSEDGSYKIINTLTGKVLELKNGDSTVGAEIITYNDIKSDAQRWYLVSKNGGYVLQCKAARTNALDIDTGGKSWIAAWEEYGGVNQIFQINKLNGGYTVRHYIQNIGGIASIKDENNYTLTDTVFVSSSSEADVTAALKSYAHRIAPNAVTVTPAADGSTLVEYFYSLMYGDVNEDNTVNASDIATLKKRLVNNENGSEMSNALSDLNGDGVINLKDMLRLKLYMADSSTKIGG